MKEMKIIETDSMIIIKNAPIEFISVIDKLPWTLFWWEGYLSDGLFGAPFLPTSYDQMVDLINKPLHELFDIEALEEEEDASIVFTLYFHIM